jgi:hypothetical protein
MASSLLVANIFIDLDEMISYRDIWSFQPLYFKDNRFDPISTAGNEIFFVFHPGTEVTLGHQDHDDLVDIIPGPIALEFFRTFSQIFDCKLITDLKKWARSMVDIRAAIFLS